MYKFINKKDHQTCRRRDGAEARGDGGDDDAKSPQSEVNPGEAGLIQ